jgi:hypothetical protein
MSAAVFAAAAEPPRLSWEAVPYVSHYEVTVEHKEGSGWKPLFKHISKNETSVEYVFKPGNYRFRVQSFDMAGRPGDISKWKTFTVTESKEKDERQKDPVSAPPPETPKTEDAAEDGGESYKQSRLSFELLYTPQVILPGGLFNDMYNDAVFQPAGFALAAGFAPLRTRGGRLGFAILPSWSYISLPQQEYPVYAHIYGVNAALSYDRYILPNTGLNIKAGGGLTVIDLYALDLNNNKAQYAHKLSVNPSIMSCITLRCYTNSAWYFNAGAEYTHVFGKDDSEVHFVKIIAGLGWWL